MQGLQCMLTKTYSKTNHSDLFPFFSTGTEEREEIKTCNNIVYSCNFYLR